MLASEARVNMKHIQEGYLSKTDIGKLVGALGRLTESKLFVDDSAGITLTEMRAKTRRLKQQEKGKLDLVVVDYLQLMTGSTGGRRYENRTQEVSAISRGLKVLAKELNAPVIALSQLSRASEQRGGEHKPMLSDLRESGSIEQDADVVAFIHRESYYKRDEKDPEMEGRAEIILAKQRNGPTDSFNLAWQSEFTRFDDLETAHTDVPLD
jgi:replicative DNA helicase